MNRLQEFLQWLIVGIAVIVIFLVLLAPSVFIRFQSIGQGTHTGYVTAVDQRGYIFKNYDVYFKTDNSSSQEDLYCVNRANEQLVMALKQASRDRKLVTIGYKGVRAIGLGLCGHTEIYRMEEDL